MAARMDRNNKNNKTGLPWRLPVLGTAELGKLGPGFGYGVGCGVGLGIGLVGGIGIGIGLPGLHFGAGFGAGCGIGIGFGYGLGHGRVYDEQGRHSHIGTSLRRGDTSAWAGIGPVVDNLVVGFKQAFENLDREIRRKKW